MSNLPSWIPDFNSEKRVARTSFADAGLRETDLDALVARHSELLADLLIENDVMDEGTSLRYLGRQFHDVDLLFVDVDEDEEPPMVSSGCLVPVRSVEVAAAPGRLVLRAL